MSEPTENGCTCNDEFVTAPCPVHQPVAQAKKEFGASSVIITDDMLVSEKQGFFQGFIFVCPACKAPAVMVNPDMGKFCCNCGQPVTVQSKTVTKYVRGL